MQDLQEKSGIIKNMANPKKEQKLPFKESVVLYFKGVRAEWGKVSWPQKQQIIGETIIVFIVVAFFTVVVFIMDLIFKGILGLIPH